MTAIADRMMTLGLTNRELARLSGWAPDSISRARSGRYCSPQLAAKLTEVLKISVEPCGTWQKVVSPEVYVDFTADIDYPHTCEVCGVPSYGERCVKHYVQLVPSQAELREFAAADRLLAKHAYDRAYHKRVREQEATG